MTASDHLGTSIILESGQTNKKTIVKKERLKDAVQDSKWKINNLMDGKYIPQDAYVIVKEALSLVSTEKQSDLLEQNCEDFSTVHGYTTARVNLDR
ncbi:unnamed protein product [Boreogadus saida]